MSQTIARVLGEARVQELRVAARGEIVTWVRTAMRRASSAEATEALVLADGTRLLLRPIRTEDRDELAALFARLTPESRRRRFLSPKHELTPRELAFLSDVDHVGHEAIAALDQRDGSIVGVGRYVHVGDRAGVAEVAVVVADELQSMGIGTALARRTVRRARVNGFTLLTATTLWENRPARALLRHLGFRTRASDGGEIELELELEPPEQSARDRVQARTLSIAASGTLLVLAVFSAFVVTIGDSARSLHGGVTGEAWALSGMSLGLATALLTAGSLVDDVGHRRVLMWSAGLLAGASVVAALAPSMAVLVAARVLQGMAGGGVLAAGLGSIGRAFPAGPARTRATGVWGAAVGAGIAVGPLAGAGLAAALGWRSAFWAEAAAAGAVMAAAATLTESRAATRRPLDLPGIATLGTGMALLTAALVEARHSWTAATTIELLSAAALLLGAFAAVELTRRRPLLDPRLFAQPQFLASITGALFTGLAVIGLMSYSPAVMQRALHLSAVGSATVLAVWSATSMVVALAARSLPGRLRAQTRLVIGLALAATGEFALTGLGTGTSWTRLLPGLLVAGIGSGIANAALGRIAVESVPHDRIGMGGGANNTARYLGGAAGVALVVTIASGAGENGLTHGWNIAALVSAGLCTLGALIIASLRSR